MAPPAALVDLVQPWASAYSDSKLLSTIVTFLHVAALVVGGGLAIATDRGTLRALRAGGETRARQLAELSGAHRLVVGGLVLATVSGLLLLAADLETYWGSWIFWLKMGLILLLLLNGGVMVRAERALRRETETGSGQESAWQRLRMTAISSLMLWLVITFVGVALVNAA